MINIGEYFNFVSVVQFREITRKYSPCQYKVFYNMSHTVVITLNTAHFIVAFDAI